MRTFNLLHRFTLCSIICALSFAAQGQDWDRTPNALAPTLKLKDIEGKSHDLRDYKGRIVIVNFWATWCAPCVAEMPSLNKLNATLDPKQTLLLTINGEADLPVVKRFMRRKALNFVVLMDDDDVASDAWDVDSVPTSFIIGPDQKIKYKAVGEVDFESRELKTILAKLAA